jgi:hypothetical protein
VLTKEIRLYVYKQFGDLGTAPSLSQISKYFKISEDQTRDELQKLTQARHIAINNEFEILMAHPFSSIPLGFSVMGAKTLWWGGCSWDSFALPNLLNQEVVIATSCPNCKSAHSWRVNPETPPQGDQIAHFLIPTKEMWLDVVHTCGNQRIFCSESCLDLWLKQTNQQRGYSMNLSTLWLLASHWYDGRLEINYERRDPTTALQYFKDVGLSGTFWGLE